jgi:pilus assembly protein Flp/PilA
MIRLFKSKSGATAIEYALMAGMVALVIFTALGVMGEKTTASFNAVASAL